MCCLRKHLQRTNELGSKLIQLPGVVNGKLSQDLSHQVILLTERVNALNVLFSTATRALVNNTH